MEETLQKEERKQQIVKERYLFIDILEVVAIFFVVLYHSTTYVYDFLTNNSFVFYLRYYLRCILSVCVPIFFFCNGFLLFSKEFNLKKHLLKILKFFILILVWGFITLGLLILINGESFSISEFLQNIFTLKQGYTNHLWYLQALICIYIIFPLLKTTFDNNKKIFTYFTIFALIITIGGNFINIIIFIFSNLVLGINTDINFNIFGLYNQFGVYGHSFAYFCLGGIVFYLVPKIKKINRNKTILISTITIIISTTIWFLFGVYISKVQNKIFSVVWEGYDTIFTLVNTISIFLIFVNVKIQNKKTEKFFELISKNTLGIYFLHWIIVIPIRNYLNKSLIFFSFGFNILYAILILLICLLISILLKKIPIIKKII